VALFDVVLTFSVVSRERSDALVELTITGSVPQVFVFDVSQIVMVALPATNPETVRMLPARLVEATLVLELLHTIYVPMPPEIVTDWLLFVDRDKLL
jgi:hypothetical protein